MVETFEERKKMAEAGDEGAQNGLGCMYCFGVGVAKDVVEGVKWYRKAAEQGNAMAQYNLGSMYSRGEGVARDELEALAWWILSANAAYAFAVGRRAELEEKLGRDATLKAQQRSKELLTEINRRKEGKK